MGFFKIIVADLVVTISDERYEFKVSVVKAA